MKMLKQKKIERPARSTRGLCPLCEKAFLRWQLQVHIKSAPPKVRRRNINVIRAQFPAWVAEDGACGHCWKAFGGIARVAECLRKFKAATHVPLAVIIVTGLIAPAGGCAKAPGVQPQVMAVQTARAESVENLRPGTEPGYIAIVRAEKETDLSFKVGGILDVIGRGPGQDWEEGSVVNAGTNLASLKQSTFTNALNSAQAQADLSTKVRERFLKLRESDAISVQEMEVTEANWLTAQAHLAQAKQDLEDSQLRASTNGAVLARYVNSGATVVAGQRVLRFADISTMSVELGVPDRMVNRFWPGKKLNVEISALEGHEPFPGRVSEVGVAASQDSRLFRVVIKVQNDEGLIKSGMTATVRVEDLLRFAPGEVRVPLSALVTGSAHIGSDARGANPKSETRTGSAAGSADRPQQLAVFVVENGKAVLRPVKTGDILNSSIIVTKGLRAGEEVVTKGASFLYDGAPVEVLQATASGR